MLNDLGVKLILLEMSDQSEGHIFLSYQMIIDFTSRISESQQPIFTEFYLKENQLNSL